MSAGRIEDIEVDGIDYSDAPDYTDAYISSAVWSDTGIPLSETELDELNEDRTLVYEQIINHIY